MARHASPPLARAMTAIGWTTDARVLLGLGAAYRLAAGRDPARRRRANHVLAVIGTTTILHHAIKKLIRQKRPDRAEVHGARNGVPLTGNASEAFPSGHAMHAGALASMVAHALPGHTAAIWAAGGAIAAARIVLLAHWTSGVVAGFAAGAAVERIWRRRTR
jgi:undecaprenyl-diphosphatase